MSLSEFPHNEYTSIYHRFPIEIPKSTRPLLILIPGNPGLVDFYITYLNLIQQKYPSFEVLCISLAGFKSYDDENINNDNNNSSFKYYDLEFQINHKIDILKYFILKENRHTELYFLSHSVGSYVTQRVIHRLIHNEEIQNKIDVKFLGLICPTIIDIGRSNSGQFFSKMIALLPVIQIAVYFSALINFLLPEKVVKAIIRNVVIDKPTSSCKEELQSLEHATSGALKIVQTKNIIQQSLNLAKEEMVTILKDDDFNDWFFKDLPEKHDVKIWTYFAHNDHWVHDNTRDHILTRYHDNESRNLMFQIGDFDDTITHSFCVNQSIEFSQVTCEKLSEFFV